jgi:hypothetical protein
MTSRFPGPVRLSPRPQINLQLTSQNRWPGPIRASFSSSTHFRPMLSPRILLRSSFAVGLWNTKDFQDSRFRSHQRQRTLQCPNQLPRRTENFPCYVGRDGLWIRRHEFSRTGGTLRQREELQHNRPRGRLRFQPRFSTHTVQASPQLLYALSPLSHASPQILCIQRLHPGGSTGYDHR